MEDEYETLCADSVENFKTIVEWMFSCGTQVKSDIDEWYSHSNVSFLEIGRTYRRKKPQTDVLLTDPGEISRRILAGAVECMQGTVWIHATVHDTNFIATKLELGAKYRLKPGCKLPPKKTKKLVPRTPEEFWPLIGRWWCRHKKDNFRSIIQSDRLSCQDEWEIAPLGSEEWQPMMKEVEVEE